MIDWEALEDIRDGLTRLREDNCRDLSTTFVPGEGDNPQAFIIGEAPGAQEEIQKRPFVGPAGKVLRQLMLLANLATDDWESEHNKSYGVGNCWVTNVVKFRPPRNRNPTDAEIRAFRPWLRQEWLAVGAPKLIIPVGGIALRAVTGKKISILRAAGKCHYYKSRSLPRLQEELAIWPMVHPSFGLRNKAVQPLLEEDWERLGVWRNAN